jgi:mannosyltransferase
LSVATADSPDTAPQGSRPQRLSGRWILAAVAGLALVAWSIYVRTRAFGEYYWIDEGLSIGIAKHGFFDIPGVLKQDGSPPLYYMLLHFWVQIFGTKESATHALSLVFSTLTIPAGLWAGWSLLGRRAGIFTAIVCAGDPFLTAYAQETRMYSLIPLLGILCTACFLHVFVMRRRRYIPWFAVTLVLLVYTHLWSSFFVLATLITVAVLAWRRPLERRALLRDALLGYGGAGLLYLPWLPTALYQLKHTGAPWASGPTWRAAEQIPRALLGTYREDVLVAVTAGFGFFAAWRRRAREEDRPGWVAVALLALTVALAWTISKKSGVWVPRYFAIFLGPLVLALGWTFARAGLIGVIGMAIIGIGFWFYPHTPDRLNIKSNARLVAADGAHWLKPGDLVLTTHPEQVPVLYYYLNRFGQHDLRYATELGYVPDVQVMDWRNCVARLRATSTRRNLLPLLDSLRPGQRMYLIRPIVSRKNEWRAPWTSLVKRRSEQWLHHMGVDRRFKLLRVSNAFLSVGHRNGAVQGRLYVKLRN